jgi:hypothetical protein
MDMPFSPWREIIPNLSLEEIQRRLATYKGELAQDQAQIGIDLLFGAGVLAKLGFLRSAAACELAAEHLKSPAPAETAGHWVIRSPKERHDMFTALYYRMDDNAGFGLRLHSASLSGVRSQVLEWFAKAGRRATCKARDEMDSPEIVETWM